MQIDQTKIEAAIVDEAVTRLINDDDLYARVKSGIDARIDKLFQERVSALVTEKVEAVTKDGFERSYTKVDSFGRPTGDPTSISKELERLIHNYWDQRVDRSGRPTDSSYSSSTRAEWMMAQICADDFSKEMKQHVVNVAGTLKDHFRSILNNHVSIMLSDVFKVQSEGDRDAKRQDSSIIAPPARPIGA